MRWLLGLLLLTSGMAGCIGTEEQLQAADASAIDEALPPEDVAWNTTGPFSQPLEEGPYDVLAPEVHVFASHDGTEIASAVWRPDVPEGTEVPVVLRISPYYFQGVDAIPEDSFEDRFWLQGIVSHGFAYAHVAVRGTAGSGGCMEFFGENEQEDVDEAVTYYGQLPWSNGNVGIWGGSYDGTTPWMAAMFDNPHLETIVPLSGLTSIWHHAYRNGTPVAFAPVFHANYWSFGWTMQGRETQDWVDNAACPESIRGSAVGPYSTLTGEMRGTPATDDYWQVRDFRERILENYEGSVFLIHGLQDWRVPPHMAYPFLNELNETGTPTKALLGQWWHDLPDRADRGEHVRWDHAEVLLRWLEDELTDADVATGPAVDVEDNRGNWRTEDRWPPDDVDWTTVHLAEDGLQREPSPAGRAVLTSPGNANDAADEAVVSDGVEVPRWTEYRVSLGELEEQVRFAGSPRLHVTLTPSSAEGARTYAELVDVGAYGDEEVLAHAVMDLRYHEGGTERHALTPGESILAQMEFFPADAVVPPGHELELRLVNGVGYTPQRDGYAAIDNFVEHPAPGPVVLHWGEGQSVLELPLIDRDVGDGTYPGQP